MALAVEFKPTGDARVDRLLEQFVLRLARFARGGRYTGRMDKFKRYKKFLMFVGERYGVQDIRGIQPRHVAAYIRYRREMGIGDKAISNDVSVIRYWHGQIPWRRYDLPENRVLFELEARLDDKTFREEIREKCYRNVRKRRQRPV